jgi:formylglycine-generating enzyme required for sulfatase activity
MAASGFVDTLQLVGTTILDKYAVESVVGEGGFAVVYRAQHVLWKRPVAVKVFKALGDVPADQRDKLLEGFIQEGALLADLSERSAAICQARDVGMLKTPKGEEVPYMVLEWLEGASLESVIHSEKSSGIPPRTLTDAIRLLEPAAEALALAHTKGIAHRDVKPANVFVLGDARGEGTVKLLDFGIAKVVQDAQKMAGAFSKTSGQITSFTPAYGAPEQFTRTHGATGPWTDVFALALVVVEVLTQRDPLDGDDFMQLAYASSNPALRPTPRARGATVEQGVTDAVEAVFAKALAVKPTERHATAGELWNALREAARMAPMRGITSRESALNLGNAATALAPPDSDIASARTVAVVGPGSGGAAAVSSAAPSSATAPKGRAGLFVGGIVGLVVIAGVVFSVGGKKEGPVPPIASSSASAGSSGAAGTASGSPSGVASAAAAAGPESCPAGMIAIPGGMFYMGSDDDLDLEKPAHQVRLSPFCIDELEVTVDRYKSCSDKGACKRASQVNEWKGISERDKKIYDPLCNIREASSRARHPINCVDWAMADNFCKAQGERLPTEAEWEFAARGPDGRKYPWGDEVPSSGHLNACGTECVAWGKKNKIDPPLLAMYPTDDGFPNTAPVGSFPQGKSRYGVQDVVGNVWEWVADYYAPYSPGAEMQTDPKGPPAGDERVIRGGAWNGSLPSWVRPTFRFQDVPSKRSYGVGFRCAKSI